MSDAAFIARAAARKLYERLATHDEIDPDVFVDVVGAELARLTASLADAETRATSAETVIADRDRCVTELAEVERELRAASEVVHAVRKELSARRWITEGRGPYDWDDDRYRDETRHAFDAIEKILDRNKRRIGHAEGHVAERDAAIARADAIQRVDEAREEVGQMRRAYKTRREEHVGVISERDRLAAEVAAVRSANEQLAAELAAVRAAWHATVPCDRCKGSGSVYYGYDDPQMQLCPTCSGTGAVRAPLPGASGKGGAR